MKNITGLALMMATIFVAAPDRSAAFDFEDLPDLPEFPEINLNSPEVSDSGPTSCSREADKIWESFQAPGLTRELRPFDEVYGGGTSVSQSPEIEMDEAPNKKSVTKTSSTLPSFLQEAS